MKKILISVLTLCVSMLVFSKGMSEETPHTLVKIATGDMSGNTFLYTNHIVDMWNNVLQEKFITVSSEDSSGGMHDISLLKGKLVNFIISTDVLVYEAQEGLGRFEEDAYTDVRFIAGMWPALFHILTISDANIERFDDIDGRAYNIGAFGSMESLVSRFALKQLSYLSPGTYIDYHYDYLDAKESMINEDIIGMSVVDAIPNPLIKDISNGTTKINLLGFSVEQFEVLKEEYATIEYYTIPRGTYLGIDHDVKTVGFKTILVTDSAVSDDVVYELLASLYQNKEALKQTIPLFDIDDVFTQIEPIMMHAGALRYYKEQGIDIPDAMQSAVPQ